MSIPEVIKKINPIANFKDKIYHPLIYRVKEGFNVREDTFIVLAIILIGLAGFGLGKLSALEKGRETVTIKPAQLSAAIVTPTSMVTNSESTKGMLVASKNGTKYYFPWCSGVSKINEANKVWFDSYESAQKAGLTAATNCPNLK